METINLIDLLNFTPNKYCCSIKGFKLMTCDQINNVYLLGSPGITNEFKVVIDTIRFLAEVCVKEKDFYLLDSRIVEHNDVNYLIIKGNEIISVDETLYICPKLKII